MTDKHDRHPSPVPRERPLLSICLPTYSRAALLRLGLRNLQEVCAAHADEIEVVVSDNASPDETPDVLAEFAHCPFIHVHRNACNIGGHANILHVVRMLARGEFCWLVGDDDYVLPGAIEEIIRMLRMHDNLDLFVINHAAVSIGERNQAIESGPAEGFPFKNSWMSKEDRSALYTGVAEVLALGGGDFRFLTHISGQIFRRRLWLEHLLGNESFNQHNPFTTLHDTYPHLMILIESAKNRKVWYHGRPAIAVGIGSQEWAGSWWLHVVLRSHKLFELYQSVDVHPEYLKKMRRYWMQFWLSSLRQLLSRKGPYATSPDLLRGFLQASARYPLLFSVCLFKQLVVEFRRKLTRAS
jgi:glycosyltransferase involved in cell wall biosynthesis